MSERKIKGFAVDIDGVMTDGMMLAMPDGDLLRQFDAKDAFAVRMASMHGYALAVITGARSTSILERMTYCGVPEEDVYLRSRVKIKDFEDFCSRHSVLPEEIIYMGDDLPDVPVLLASHGVVPADAAPEAKAAAKRVSHLPGGRGFVREVIEGVMREQGDWDLDVFLYEKQF